MILTVLSLLSPAASADCVLNGARPTVTLPTTIRGQEFSFVASPDCETLRFSIRGSTFTKLPRTDQPPGSGSRTFKVHLSESEWDAVVAETRGALTWIVTGRTGAGVTTRLETTNEIDRGGGMAIDLSMADATFVGRKGDYVGSSPAGAGDVNGDGNDDLLIGAEGNSAGGVGAGAVYLVLGPVMGPLGPADAHATFVGEEEWDLAGASTAGAGDVDDDGHADILIGAEGNHGSGAAYLVLGPVTGTLDLSAADAKLVAEDYFDHAGQAVSGARDVDADGKDDVLISSGGNAFVDPRRSDVYLLLGPVTGTIDLGLADARLESEPLISDVAFVSDAGDVDGDGHDDLVIGTPYIDGEDALGAAYVVRGPVTGTSELALADAKFVGEASGDVAGISVSDAGDVDGDGYADVMIGSHNAEGGIAGGAAYLVRGPMSASGDLSLADAKLFGHETDSASRVAGAGDVDGDGHDDMLVGAFYDSEGALSAGAAYLVLGPVTGTVDLVGADVRFLGENEADLAGSGVAGAGDVDADGRDDLLVGAIGYGPPATIGPGMSRGAVFLFYGGGL